MRDLNDLSFFAAVVTHGGFSAAARALGAPKSRISRRIAALEEQLGVRLIERSTRRFSVTEVGQDVYRHARAALAEIEAVDDVAMRLRAEPQGLVRVSCPLGVERVLSIALPDFMRQHPRLRIQLVVTNRRIDLIEEGIDIAIRVRERFDTDAELQMKVMGRSRALLCASPAFLNTHGRPQAPGDLARFATLSHLERPGADHWTLLGPGEAQVRIAHEPRISTHDFEILRDAARQGMGIALLPDLHCQQDIADGRLEHILPEWSSPEGTLHLVFTSRRGLLPGVRAVIDFIAQALACQYHA